MPELYFRHSKIRNHQKQMVADVYAAIEGKKHLLAHAPCGIGKTDAALSPAMTYALEHNLDVFFLTPKISQHKLAAEVVRGLAEKYELEVRGVDIIGRRHACIHPAFESLDYEAFYPSCERLRMGGRCGFYTNAKGSGKLQEAKAELLFHKFLTDYGRIKTYDETMAKSRELHACPYEIMLKLSGSSRIIIADYFHIIEPKIREVFMKKAGKKLENSIVIIDEAHNLPARVRDYLSLSFNSRMASRMEKEMAVLGQKLRFEREFNLWAGELLGETEETLLPAEQFSSLLAHFQMKPDEVADYFQAFGLQYVDASGKKSALLKFSKFVSGWFEDSEATVRILHGKRGFYSLGKRFMDPGIITSNLNEAHSTILMSATLHPMGMYRDVLGLDPARTVMKYYPSPFPKPNRLNMIVQGATTRYSQRTPEEYEKIAGIIDAIHGSKNATAAFFPSYKVLNSIVPLIKSVPKYVQGERMKPKELHALAKDFSAKGGMLVAVQGGSLSEGVDFNNGEIKNAVIVGIALEEMSLEIRSLIDYYQKKFGKGMDYAYIYPGITRALQSAGRAIRKDEDKAAIIYLDERFSWNNYKKILPKEEEFLVVNPEGLGNSLKRFWNSKS